MKSNKRLRVAASAVAGVMALCATGQASVSGYVLDEWGCGFDVNGLPLNGTRLAGGGVDYNLALADTSVVVTPGWVGLFAAAENPSDLIHFYNDGNGNGHAIFYSDATDGADAPADVDFRTSLTRIGFPGFLSAAPITEVGPEGNNGAFYDPADGEAGFIDDGSGSSVYSYSLESDSAPCTPDGGTTLSLLGLGLAGLFGIKRRLMVAK